MHARTQATLLSTADAPADLVTDRARDVPAHERGHRPTEGPVDETLLHVRVLGVEALGRECAETKLSRALKLRLSYFL